MEPKHATTKMKNSLREEFFSCGGAVLALHGLTAHFCLGVRRAVIYLPNLLILLAQDRSLPLLILPLHTSSLVHGTVPDVLTPIERLQE